MFGPPRGIRNRVLLGKAPLQILGVRQAGVMTGDAQRQHAAEVCPVLLRGDARALGGMVHAARPAANVGLERRRCLAGIVQQPGRARRPGPAEDAGEFSSQRGYRPGMRP